MGARTDAVDGERKKERDHVTLERESRERKEERRTEMSADVKKEAERERGREGVESCTASGGLSLSVISAVADFCNV